MYGYHRRDNGELVEGLVAAQRHRGAKQNLEQQEEWVQMRWERKKTYAAEQRYWRQANGRKGNN